MTKLSKVVADLQKIPVKVDILFLFFLAITFIDNLLRENLPTALERCLIILIAYSCVFLHEMGHVIIAGLYGYTTTKITVSFFGAMAEIVGISFRGSQTIIICLAGPLVNLILALVFSFLHKIFNSSQLLTLMQINIALAIFNLLPIYPFDGGRIHRAFLFYIVNDSLAVLISNITSLIGVVGLLVLAVLTGNFILIFICLMVFLVLFVDFKFRHNQQYLN